MTASIIRLTDTGALALIAPMRKALLVRILAAASVASGCSDASSKTTLSARPAPSSRASAGPSKMEQCNTVVETVNQGSEPIKRFDASGDLEKQAKDLEAFEAKIGALTLADTELKGLVDGYRKMIDDMVKLSRDLKRVDENTNVAELEKRADAIAKTESDLVDKVNAYCRL